jgi:glycosyltransferase involved in cell wall biosynthesis
VDVLIWYWGRRGGGVHYTAAVADALAPTEYQISASVSNEMESPARIEAGVPNTRKFSLHPPVGLLSAMASLRRADVILHTMVNPLTPFGLLGAIGKPLVSVIHDARPHPGDEHRVQDAAVRLAIRRSTALIVASEYVKAQLPERHRVKAHVIPLPPLLSLEGRWNPNGPVVFLGRFSTYKGLDLLAESWSRSPFRSSVELKVVGSGPDELVAPLRALGATVENRWVPDEEIGKILQGARLVVLPYREASQSGVITLAKAAGIPVLATNVGGLPEQLQIGGRAVPFDQFGSSLDELLANPRILADLHSELVRITDPTGSQRLFAEALMEVLRPLARTK